MTGDSSFDRSPVIVNRHTLEIINRKSSFELHRSIASHSRILSLVIQTCNLWHLKHSPQIASYSIKDQGSNKHLIVKLKNKYFIKQIAIMFMIRGAVIYEKNSFCIEKSGYFSFLTILFHSWNVYVAILMNLLYFIRWNFNCYLYSITINQRSFA